MRKENRSVAETTDNYVFKHMRKMEEVKHVLTRLLQTI